MPPGLTLTELRNAAPGDVPLRTSSSSLGTALAFAACRGAVAFDGLLWLPPPHPPRPTASEPIVVTTAILLNKSRSPPVSRDHIRGPVV